jgi:peptidyl-prolyl cis-trans isomerase A (cyclophilin A)
MAFSSLGLRFYGLLGCGALGLAVACSSSTDAAGDDKDDKSADEDDDSDDSDDDSDDDDDSDKPKDAGSGKDAAPVDPFLGCTRDIALEPDASLGGDASVDPVGSAEQFTLAKALAGFPTSDGTLVAVITTELGTIRCELLETDAPISVANFVGLARGTRPFKKDGKWQVGRFYDGLIWHRVIPDFVIQGGDPAGTGSGGPGYDLVEENQVDEPEGTLAMAAGATPSGSQFYVVVGTGPAANYNVFGTCETKAAIQIANVPVNAKDKPITPVHMTKVDIARCK